MVSSKSMEPKSLTVGLVYQADPLSGGAANYETALGELVKLIAPDVGLTVKEFFPRSSKAKSRKKRDSLATSGEYFYSLSLLSLGILWMIRTFPGRVFLKAMGIQKIRLERMLSQQGVDFVYFASPNALALGVSDMPMVTTVWDLGHRDLPEFAEISGKGSWQSRELYFSETVPRSIQVVTDSNATGDKLEKFYGLSKERRTVLGLLPRVLPPSTNTHLVPQVPYVIYPAMKWAHKNHLVLLRALKLLETRGVNVSLVLTGSDKGFGTKISDTARHLGLESKVLDFGFVDQRDLALLITNAQALVMPSKLGPTNLPPLQSVALGTRAIVSDAHKFDEDFGEMIQVCSKDSAEEWAQAIESALGKKGDLPQELNVDQEKSILKAMFFKLVSTISDLERRA
jgi:glycosyltransferase involved in cell wall biosynthesis